MKKEGFEESPSTALFDGLTGENDDLERGLV